MALHGVNLGGWLILERWMTPSVFNGTDATDEYGFMQTSGAIHTLRQHQKTFITEQDFAWMAKNGVQIVRIPVGYWILHGDSPYVSSIGRLDWAFSMCKRYTIKILLDIHGLPGSQNGHDHSGKVGKVLWYKNKDFIQQGQNITIELTKRYAHSPVLWGIQIVNEPQIGLLQIKLRRYCNRLYGQLIDILPSGVRIIFPDAFTPRLMSAAVWEHQPHPTYMDIHWYHFVGWGRVRPSLYKYIIKSHGQLIKRLQKWNGIIVGEWSGCYSQRIFDAYPVKTHDTMVRIHIEHQLRAYECADVWFYWSYKTERPGVWNYKSLVDSGIINLS